jgi:hypothetical protein
LFSLALERVGSASCSSRLSWKSRALGAYQAATKF